MDKFKTNQPCDLKLVMIKINTKITPFVCM